MMYNAIMNELNKSTYEALAGEYEEQQIVLADESADKEMMEDMELLYNDPEKIWESDEEDDPYEDVL
tara:strand:- start:32 stop:232 length:201 start_codon:yes stop_codon:yes gene_type:complete